MLVTIDKAGRIVIPIKMRQKLHLNPGDSLKIAEIGYAIHLEPQRDEGEIVYKDGVPVLTFKGRAPVDFDVRASLNEDYDRRAELHSGADSAPDGFAEPVRLED